MFSSCSFSFSLEQPPVGRVFPRRAAFEDNSVQSQMCFFLLPPGRQITGKSRELIKGGAAQGPEATWDTAPSEQDAFEDRMCRCCWLLCWGWGQGSYSSLRGEHQGTESHLRVRGLNGCTAHSLGAEAGRFPGGV